MHKTTADAEADELNGLLEQLPPLVEDKTFAQRVLVLIFARMLRLDLEHKNLKRDYKKISKIMPNMITYSANSVAQLVMLYDAKLSQ